MVRAKFKVRTIVQSTEGSEINLDPVTHGSPENENFYRYTPYGSIQLGTVNAEAAKQFNPGDEFYVDFIPVLKKEYEDMENVYVDGDDPAMVE